LTGGEKDSIVSKWHTRGQLHSGKHVPQTHGVDTKKEMIHNNFDMSSKDPKYWMETYSRGERLFSSESL
jgi:hypothetical protein